MGLKDLISKVGVEYRDGPVQHAQGPRSGAYGMRDGSIGSGLRGQSFRGIGSMPSGSE